MSAASEAFDWRGYPKGTFFKYGKGVHATINKNYVFSLGMKRNAQVNWTTVIKDDIKVLGYVPSDFFK